jgi:hypothetical protein
MKVEQVVPILNVSDVEASFAWFAKMGWSTRFQWDAEDPGAPPGFGGVSCDGCEIFLCRDGQGSRGPGANVRTGDPGRRPAGGQGRLGVDLGRRRGPRPRTLLGRALGGHAPADRRAVGCARDARAAPRRHVFRISRERSATG